MSDGGRRKVDGNVVFLLPNRRIRPNSTKTSTILLNFVDQIVNRFWGLEKAGAATQKAGAESQKADAAPQKSGRGNSKIPHLPPKSPSGDDLRRGGLVNRF